MERAKLNFVYVLETFRAAHVVYFENSMVMIDMIVFLYCFMLGTFTVWHWIELLCSCLLSTRNCCSKINLEINL